MTHRMPIIQPLWSFASIAARPTTAATLLCNQVQSRAGMQGWATGEDGRPHLEVAIPSKS